MKLRIIAIVLSMFAAWYVNADCTGCHAGHAENLQGTAHADLPVPAGDDNACASCHGDAAKHILNPMSGGVLAFSNETPIVQDAACGSCHRDTHAAPKSAHAMAGLACSDCHTVHEPPARASAPLGFEQLEAGTAACVGCHEDVLARFAFTKRHRLHENSVTCVSCHDPHAPPERLQLGAVKQERCVGCHAETAGPFVFEHGASRVDGCLACHAPHGSPNRFLLTHQKVGEQCYSCHAGVPQFHLGFAPVGSPRFGTDSVCTNCHSTIHGSNLDPSFLK